MSGSSSPPTRKAGGSRQCRDRAFPVFQRRGVQGPSTSLPAMPQSGIAVSPNPFPGLGRVRGNPDFPPAPDTMTTATAPYLQSFKDGIAANADFVMVALALYPEIDPSPLAAFSSTAMTQ